MDRSSPRRKSMGETDCKYPPKYPQQQQFMWERKNQLDRAARVSLFQRFHLFPLAWSFPGSRTNWKESMKERELTHVTVTLKEIERNRKATFFSLCSFPPCLFVLLNMVVFFFFSQPFEWNLVGPTSLVLQITERPSDILIPRIVSFH